MDCCVIGTSNLVRKRPYLSPCSPLAPIGQLGRQRARPLPHIVAKVNNTVDEVRAGEARELVRQGYEPVLKHARWCFLKNPI